MGERVRVNVSNVLSYPGVRINVSNVLPMGQERGEGGLMSVMCTTVSGNEG